MKKIILFLISLMLFACEKPQMFYDNEIVFGSTETKAIAGSGPSGYGEFKVFSEEANMNPYTVQGTGNSWEYDGVSSQTKQFFSRDFSEYNFTAIISDKEGTFANNTVTVNDVEAFLTDDEGNTPKEFLGAGTTTSDYNSHVTLNFKHGNAKMYIGFASDRADTQILDYVPETPEVKDTTDTGINLKRSYSAVGSSTKLKGPGESTYTNAAPLPANLVAEIKSYYSIDGCDPGDYDLHMGNSVGPSNVLKQLRVVKEIPASYKISMEMHTTGIVMDFFDGFKYLKDNGYDIQPGTTGGKPDVGNYILIDAFVNGSAYTVVGLNCGDSNAVPQYTVVTTPGNPAISGIRVFSVDAEASPKVITNHTVSATANVTTTANTFISPVSDNEVITFTKCVSPVAQVADKTSILLDTPVTMSPSVWYAVPVDNTAYVIKFSYVYNNITKYDARVLIPIESANFQQGHYYKYVIYIDENTGGTTSADSATADKNEVDTIEKPIIFDNITFDTYNGHLIIL